LYARRSTSTRRRHEWFPDRMSRRRPTCFGLCPGADGCTARQKYTESIRRSGPKRFPLCLVPARPATERRVDCRHQLRRGVEGCGRWPSWRLGRSGGCAPGVAGVEGGWSGRGSASSACTVSGAGRAAGLPYRATACRSSRTGEGGSSDAPSLTMRFPGRVAWIRTRAESSAQGWVGIQTHFARTFRGDSHRHLRNAPSDFAMSRAGVAGEFVGRRPSSGSQPRGDGVTPSRDRNAVRNRMPTVKQIANLPKRHGLRSLGSAASGSPVGAQAVRRRRAKDAMMRLAVNSIAGRTGTGTKKPSAVAALALVEAVGVHGLIAATANRPARRGGLEHPDMRE